MSDSLNFSGIISKVSSDGRAAVVRLEKTVEGKKLGVISDSTLGRIQLMNGIGKLEKNTKVNGKAVDGPDALLITAVKEAC